MKFRTNVEVIGRNQREREVSLKFRFPHDEVTLFELHRKFESSRLVILKRKKCLPSAEKSRNLKPILKNREGERERERKRVFRTIKSSFRVSFRPSFTMRINRWLSSSIEASSCTDIDQGLCRIGRREFSFVDSREPFRTTYLCFIVRSRHFDARRMRY